LILLHRALPLSVGTLPRANPADRYATGRSRCCFVVSAGTWCLGVEWFSHLECPLLL